MATNYPFKDGDFKVIGPECFTGDGLTQPDSVISYQGENYYKRSDDETSVAILAYGDAERLADTESLYDIEEILADYNIALAMPTSVNNKENN